MSKQCLDIHQMQHLKELGVDTKTASLCWVCLNSEPYISFYDKEYPQEDTKVIPAFTLQDILDLLPNLIHSQEEENNYWLEFGTAMVDEEWWYIRYMSVYGVKLNYEEHVHLIDAAYEMLCWCIVNGYVETKK
jgi:hypothetical protein